MTAHRRAQFVEAVAWKLRFRSRHGPGQRRGGAQQIVRYFEPL
jgi:hypothetical protein